MQQQVYHSHAIQAWEQRWFGQQNSAYGLMKQVAWMTAQRLISSFDLQFESRNKATVAMCCGQGNNAGDGYLIAKYLFQAGFRVDVYTAPLGMSKDLHAAEREALRVGCAYSFRLRFSTKLRCLY